MWTAYRVFGIAKTASPPRPIRFSVDQRTPAKVRHDDYTTSGFDLGHMAPNYAIAARYGAQSQLESFLMSNVTLQRPALNQNLWRRLEEKIANDLSVRFEEVRVTTGAVFDPNVNRLLSGVEIPDALFKILVDEDAGKPRVIAFLARRDVNGNESLEQILISVDDIERQSEFDFLTEIEDRLEEALESAKPGQLW